MKNTNQPEEPDIPSHPDPLIALRIRAAYMRAELMDVIMRSLSDDDFKAVQEAAQAMVAPADKADLHPKIYYLAVLLIHAQAMKDLADCYPEKLLPL